MLPSNIWCTEKGSNLRREALQASALPAELSVRCNRWRRVGDSNPWLPLRQRGTLATELTRRGEVATRTGFEPVTTRVTGVHSTAELTCHESVLVLEVG